ncbi:hypothetical protein H6G03_34300 [Planktothrix sp. FACHB-1375]|uniref:Uncharacterized protein n=1 Tax=Aerosakkonema funiforme FACHB-1375 TaxID=2949571 RepID=A0A926VLQ6_9CYAN|nr:hypothetical protein [Aerosakkonema funiforme FACHB-1375]
MSIKPKDEFNFCQGQRGTTHTEQGFPRYLSPHQAIAAVREYLAHRADCQLLSLLLMMTNPETLMLEGSIKRYIALL